MIWDEPTEPEYRDSRYQMWDTMAMEVEVARWVGATVEMLKPGVVVELGSWKGHVGAVVGLALKANNYGRGWTLEINEDLAAQTKARVEANVDERWMKPVLADAYDWEPTEWPIDLLIVDTDIDNRLPLLERYRKWMVDGTWVMVHDTAIAPRMRDEMRGVDWVQWVELPTPRGMMFGRAR